MDSTLARIQRWYAAQCDGDWEHGSGVEITTLDNPGWLIKIDLTSTDLEGREFVPLSEGLEPSLNEWHSISVTGTIFQAAGDPTKLDLMLQTFLDWAENPDR